MVILKDVSCVCTHLLALYWSIHCCLGCIRRPHFKVHLTSCQIQANSLTLQYAACPCLSPLCTDVTTFTTGGRQSAKRTSNHDRPPLCDCWEFRQLVPNTWYRPDITISRGTSPSQWWLVWTTEHNFLTSESINSCQIGAKYWADLEHLPIRELYEDHSEVFGHRDTLYLESQERFVVMNS